MSELFSSAWNYLSGGGGGGEGTGGSRFVGLEVDMGGGKVVKIKKTIAEGQVILYSCMYINLTRAHDQFVYHIYMYMWPVYINYLVYQQDDELCQ